MNTRCISFYLDFSQPIFLLTVALYSLERQYNGNIHISYGPNVPKWFVDILKRHARVSTQLVTTKGKCCRVCALAHRNQSAADGKSGFAHCCPQTHRDIPFGTRVMFDCDHVFIKPMENGVFEHVEQFDMSCFGFEVEHLRRMAIQKSTEVAAEIQAIGLPCDKVLQPSIGSCLGSTIQGAKLLDEWEEFILKFAASKKRMLTTKFVDQHALSYVMWRNKIPIGDNRYSYSGQVANQSDIKPPPADVMSIHFCHGRFMKRGADHIYGTTLGEAIKSDFLGLNTEIKRYLAIHRPLLAYGPRLAIEHPTHGAVFAAAMKRAK